MHPAATICLLFSVAALLALGLPRTWAWLWESASDETPWRDEQPPLTREEPQ